MKPTLVPVAQASGCNFPKLQTVLLGIALLGAATDGCAQGGTVIAWGDNRHGQTNLPSGLTNVVAIASGEWHNLALKADGTVIAWGADNAGQGSVPSDLSNVVVIAAAGFHNLALKADGTVRAWGQNEFGQADVPAGLSNVVDIAGGWSHSLALKADGTVVAWGLNEQGQATVPPGLSNVVAVASGEYHNLALKADGTVTAWGWNGVGQTSVPEGLSNVLAIAASGLHSLALKADGTVVGWGGNEAWANSDCQFLGHPGCVREPSGQIDIPEDLGNVVAISAGNFHSLALEADGALLPSVLLSNSMREANTFNFSANTQRGRVYALEYKDSLATTNWTLISLVSGTGAERVFSDSAAGVAERFYRLRWW